MWFQVDKECYWKYCRTPPFYSITINNPPSCLGSTVIVLVVVMMPASIWYSKLHCAWILLLLFSKLTFFSDILFFCTDLTNVCTWISFDGRFGSPLHCIKRCMFTFSITNRVNNVLCAITIGNKLQKLWCPHEFANYKYASELWTQEEGYRSWILTYWKDQAYHLPQFWTSEHIQIQMSQ